MTEPDLTPADERLARSGLGTLCSEAQADGVPCAAVRRDCCICDHADAHRDDCPGEWTNS